MDSLSKLISSVAELAGSVAFPGVLLIALMMFRNEVKAAIGALCTAIGKVRKATLPGIIIELDRLAESETGSGAEKGGHVTARQVEAAARIRIQSNNAEPHEITNELDKLCLEYDGLRRTMPASRSRTNALTRTIVKMRLLAPSALAFLDVYKGSGSPGSRLAAVAMMQMAPHHADLDWLRDRFATEQPFIFYHAALALENAANVIKDYAGQKRLLSIAQQSLASVKSFSGKPDHETIVILDSLISSLEGKLKLPQPTPPEAPERT